MLRLVRLKCRVHCYATEDVEKVKKAVESVLEGAVYSIKTTRLEGHYGDPIHIIEYDVVDSSDVAKIFKKIISNIGLGVVGVEEKSGSSGKFHIRLDKQMAYFGKISAEDVDPVKMEFNYEGDWTEVYRWVENL